MNTKKNTKITIVELCSPNHSNLIQSWLQVFGCNKSTNINLFTSKTVFERLDITSDFSYASNNKLILFYQLCKIIRCNDHVIFNSIQTRFLMFSLLMIFKQGKFTLCIHNSNAWKGENKGPFLKRIIKRICRKVIISRMDNLSFCSQVVADSFPVNDDVNKIVLPFQLSGNINDNSKVRINNEVVVVYPGIVSKNRKNYTEVIKAFRILGDDFHLYLLGRPNVSEGGDEVVDMCSVYNNIKTYKDFVPQTEFCKLMTSCDFLFSDLGDCRFKRYDYDEIYGLTKDSGVTHLIAKYNKPAILNHQFSMYMGSSLPLLSFSNANDIVRILRDYSEKREYSIEVNENLKQVSVNAHSSLIYEKIKHVYF